jgi:hypothetical protein
MNNQSARWRVIAAAGVLLILTTMVTGCKSTEIPCRWAENEMVIDGAADDWKDMQLTYFEDHNMILGVGNDTENLYLLLRTNDMNLVRTIGMSGITIWLNEEGKKDKNLSVNFRGGPTMAELSEAGLIDTTRTNHQMPQMRPGMESPMNNREGQRTQLKVIDKKLEHEDIIALTGANGPEIGYGIDQGLVVYELRMPLGEHMVDYYRFNAIPGNEICINAEWGGKPERPQGMGGGMRGGSGRGGGGMPGGGPPGGGGPGGMRGQMQTSEGDIWIKTVLATGIESVTEGDAN